MSDGVEGLRSALERLNLRDKIVFVHSSWTALSHLGESWKPAIELLCRSVGRGGTLVMPAYPMRGLSQSHLERHPFFDCRRTPSQAGLLSEIFRRMSQVRRSLHPTHSVTAWGAWAVELTTGHEHSPTPFDESSPFQKMYEGEATVLNLGVRNMTFRHLADHLIQDELPHSVYADQVIRVRLIDSKGVEKWMETRGHNPLVTCNHEVVLDQMRQEGAKLPPRRFHRTGGSGARTLCQDVDGILLELTPVRPYVELYHRCFREGTLRFFPRNGAHGR
jgi:aminoglycoside N3'-acetyltransferase